MKELTIKTILILIWILSTLSCLGQDSVRCDPMWKARELREMAMKSRNSDKIINSQDSVIYIQHEANNELAASYAREMGMVNQELKLAEAKTDEVWKVAYSFRDQLTASRKKERKVRWQRNGLGVLLVGVIVCSITQ